MPKILRSKRAVTDEADMAVLGNTVNKCAEPDKRRTDDRIPNQG
jgi:hypothetical protein